MKQGRRIILLRRITLISVFVLVIASVAFDTGFGTPSAFGVGEFFLLCPLGGIEAMIASKSFIPITALSLLVVLVFALLFGRAWCAWGCPAPGIRSFFKRQPKKDSVLESKEEALCDQTSDCSSCSTHSHEKGFYRKEFFSVVSRDKRVWVLAGVVLVTFIIGFPIFCLLCPIGLTFGSVISLWHLIVDKQVTASVIVFPLALAVELLIYRKWCVNLCPIAGLLGIFGHAAKLFRPRVDASTCLLYTSDKKCNVCTHVCPENINMHTPQGPVTLKDCTRCGECLKNCPTQSISIKVKPSDPVV